MQNEEFFLLNFFLGNDGEDDGIQGSQQPPTWIWVNQPIYSFFVGCVNSCVQGTNVRVVSLQASNVHINGTRRTNCWLQMNMLNYFEETNNRLNVMKTSEKSLIFLEESMEYTSNQYNENQKTTTCNRLDLGTLARILIHCAHIVHNIPGDFGHN